MLHFLSVFAAGGATSHRGIMILIHFSVLQSFFLLHFTHTLWCLTGIVCKFVLMLLEILLTGECVTWEYLDLWFYELVIPLFTLAEGPLVLFVRILITAPGVLLFPEKGCRRTVVDHVAVGSMVRLLERVVLLLVEIQVQVTFILFTDCFSRFTILASARITARGVLLTTSAQKKKIFKKPQNLPLDLLQIRRRYRLLRRFLVGLLDDWCELLLLFRRVPEQGRLIWRLVLDLLHTVQTLLVHFVITRAMVVKHAHGRLEVVESLRIDSSDLFVSHLFAHDNLVQIVCSRILGHSQKFTNQGDLEGLVNPALVLPMRGVEIVLNAIIGASR